MNEDDASTVNEEDLAALLAACDEALATGNRPEELCPSGAASVLAPQIQRDLAYVQRLRQVLRRPAPPHNRPAMAGSDVPLPPGAAAAEPSAGLPWTSLGRFQLRRELGRGGFGIVFLAYDPLLGREVALKVPREDVLVTPDLRERFQREARAASGLEHPNLVPVYEAGEVGLVCFIVSAYCPGNTLAAWLKERREPVPFRMAATLVATLAGAVQHAHERGVLHRDLKPSNVLLTPVPASREEALGFTPKVTDFGLAKLVGSAPAAAAPGDPTRSGAIVGTPSYMAPEQANGKTRNIGSAADVYALGAILYELLTGRPPFRGETDLETLLQVRSDEPVPPTRLRPKVPRDLETICLKCLQKEPGRRYASATALAYDLQRFLDRKPIQARPVGRTERLWRWCQRHPDVASLTASVAMLLLLVAGGASVAAFLLSAQLLQTEQARDRANAILVRASVAHGVQLLDSGDALGALPWFAQALERDQEDPARVAMHRARLAGVIQYAPRLAQAWFHEGMVTHAEFSPDGHYVVSASHDGTARVCDVASGAPVTPQLRQSGGGELYAAFSPNSRLVVTAGANEARLWEVATGKPLATWKLGGLAKGAFSPDSRLVVTWGATAKGGEARVWEVATGKPVTPAFQHPWPVASASFSPDGRHLLTASSIYTPPGKHEGGARVWDVATGEPVTPFFSQRTGVPQAWFSPDGRRVLTANSFGDAGVWEATTGKRVATLQDSQPAGLVAFSPDGHLVLTASQYGQARVWDASTGAPRTPAIPHASAVRHVSFSPDGSLFLTACTDGTVWLRDGASGKPVAAPLRHSGSVRYAAFSPDGTQVVTASDDECVRVWDFAPRWPLVFFQEIPGLGGRQLGQFSPDPDSSRVLTAGMNQPAQVWDLATGNAVVLGSRANLAHVAFSRDGRCVLTCGFDGTARVWEAASGQPLTPPLDHNKQRVSHGSFSPDGSRVVTACADGTVRVWSVATGKVVGPPLTHGAVRALFNVDGDKILTAGGDFARLWDASTGEPTTTLKCAVQVCEAAFSPDGRRLLTACVDGSAQVWETATGKPIGRPLRQGSNIEKTSFSPDGSRVVLACTGATARVWNAATGEPVTPPLRHSFRVMSAAFSSDGRRVVTAARDSTVRIWDAATGEPLTPPLDQGAWVQDASFSPDGRRLLTVCDDRTVRVWELPQDDRPVADLVELAQLLSASRLDAQGDLVPLGPADLRAAWQALRANYPGDFTRAPGTAAAMTERAHKQRGIALQTARVCNNEAWSLITGPEPRRDPAGALPLAERAVALAPDEPMCLNTLGVVYYRLGRYEPAAAALERSLHESKGAHAAYDLFVLAMCHARRGDAVKAKDCYDRAVQWVQERQGKLDPRESQELTAFRAEAEALVKGLKP
jgi:WD40 repeat protein